MKILIERIEGSASGERSFTSVVGGQETTVSWAELNRLATSSAAELQSRSIRHGDRVAVLATTSLEILITMQAVWLAGATVVILPLPMRMGSMSAFIEATMKRIKTAECAAVIVDPQFSGFAKECSEPVFGLKEIAQTSASVEDFVRPAYAENDVPILQFTSGSTSDPKGVVLPNHVVVSNIEAMVGAAGLDVDRDVMVSWLPLYHDMGLIGCCVQPMALGMNLVLGSPQDFLGSPRRWMEWISTYSGTITAGPNFSYVLAARGLRRPGEKLDLSSLRIAGNGAEPVDPECVRDFAAAAREHGLDEKAIFPVFGMAELAIGGAFPEQSSGMTIDVVDGEILEVEGRAAPVEADHENAREMVRLGFALPGLEFRICDPDTGQTLDERQVGELQIKGTSVAPGYYKDPEATVKLFDGEWLKTGDLGYLVDDQLVLCGRIKDLIIVGGRNVYPQDIERAVGALSGIRAGNVVAFSNVGRRNKESVVVVAEVRNKPDAELSDAVVGAVKSSVGLPCRETVFVKRGSLPKTSSGKLQRALTAQRYEDGELAVVQK